MSDIEAEPDRNRILRRADWRFLLPNPRPAKAIYFAERHLAEAVRAIAVATVDGHRTRSRGDCDLAVAMDPDAATLRAAWEALRPGGACYTEWFSLGVRARQTISARLREAGFEDVTYYCARATATGAPAWWVPFERRAAVRYFLTQWPHSRRLTSLFTRAARQVRWRLARWVPVLVPKPVSAVARKPSPVAADASGPGKGATRRQALTELILDRWNRWGFGALPAHLSWLLRTDGFRSRNKVVAFVFAEPERCPRLVIKMPRIAQSADGLVNEAATLSTLAARPEPVRGVPSLLFLEQQAGLVFLGETVLDGRRLDSVINRDNYRTIAVAATAWLVALAGEVSSSAPSAWWDRLPGSVLARFESAFSPVFEPGALREAREIVGTLGALPLVCEHRDFNQFNILQTPRGDLAVLDWESSVLQGLPALDLVYFLTCVSLFALERASDPEEIRRAYRSSIDPGTPIGAAAAECLATYAGRVGLDPSNFRALRLLAWMLHSCSEYERLAFDLGHRPEPDILKRGVFATLWEEELRHARY